MSASRVFQRLTKGERIWALDRAVAVLAQESKRRAASRRRHAAGELDSVELERALDILFQMSVEIESGMRP